MSNQTPAEKRAELWALYGPEMRAELAKAPPLSPDQIRTIRGIWLAIITQGPALPIDIHSPSDHR
jgi:hypothetical protein